MLHLVLVSPEIPPNTGNVARLCAATRTRLHIVGPAGFDINDPAFRRAGMDYLDLLDLQPWNSWDDFAPVLASHRFHLFSTKAATTLWQAKFEDGDYLIFGREKKGLPESLLNQHPNRCVRIPQFHPDARSLNLATAAGIGLYEALRQTSTFC